MSRGRTGFRIVFALAAAIAAGIVGPDLLSYLYKIIYDQSKGRSSPPLIVSTGADIYPAAHSVATVAACGMLGLILGGIASGFLLRVWDLRNKWDAWERGDKVNLVVGMFGGLIASTPIVTLLGSMELGKYHLLALFGVWLGCVAATVYALHSMGDILPWAKDSGPSKRRGIKILDTNILIDGRIYDVAKTGFLDGQLYVPGFVLDELQYIADSHDPLRRQRGRRGLDVLRMLQADYPTEVRIYDKSAPEVGDEVDGRLVRLARAIGGDIVTNDFNLNRVASMQQVKVLNLNDLALAIRPNVLPSETLEIAIIREGNQPGQGVGYLEDGTMVVVEDGKPFLGSTQIVTVTQVIQTERGKMIFGEIGEESDEIDSKRNSHVGESRYRSPRRRS